MVDDVCFALLRNTIYQILHSAGFESSHGEPANVLADIFGQYIQLLASSASTYAQLAGRTVASPWDIADGLVDVQVTLEQLQDWLDSEQGQFLAPSWSTKADPNLVLKDVVTKGQVHHGASQILYQYCAADQHYYQSKDTKLEYTNGDDVIGTAATATVPSSSAMRLDRGQHIVSLPDYVPLHLPSFPSPDSDDIVNQSNDTPHQSNQKRDHTTMQSEHSTNTMLSSLFTSTDHKLPSSSHTSLSISKKTNDNPFTHVVSFDDSSLASGNSLSLALSSAYSKPSSSLQQPQQLDLDERNELELAKKQRRAEINGTMEATINTIMEQYRQQQKALYVDGNQVMFQHITQKEAIPGKTSLGTRDSILDEMVYRLAPPVALARLSSPNLLLDTAITPENHASVSDAAGKDAPIEEKDIANRSKQISPPPPPPSSTSKQNASIPPLRTLQPPSKKTISSSQTTDQLEKSPTIPSPAILSATTSLKVNSPPSSISTTTQLSQSNHTASFGSPPIPTPSQPPVKTPMSIAMLSARGSTNSIKKDKNGFSVKIADEAKNGTILPKKKKKPRVSMDMVDSTKQIPPMPHPQSSSTAAATKISSKQHQHQLVTLPTNSSVAGTTLLRKKKKKKDDSNGLGRQRRAEDTPPKVRFKEQVDISNSSYEQHYSATPSPSFQHSTQSILSTKPIITATSTVTPHSSMIFPPTAATESSPAPWPSSTIPTSSSSFAVTSDQSKKKKKKKHDDQQVRFSHSPMAKAPTSSSLAAELALPTPLSTTPTKMANSLYYPPQKLAAPPPMPSSSSSSSYSSTMPVARATAASTTTTTATMATVAPIMLLPTPATNIYYDTAETVQCICENPTVDYGTFMISCDRCLVWFHGSCVRIAEHDQVDYWICTRCQ